MRHTRVLLTIVAIPLLALAGCSDDDGGDASSDTTSTTAADASSEESFTEVVNGLCGESASAMGEIFGPMASLDGPPSEEMLQSTYDALLAQLKSEQAEFEALTPPADQEEDWDALLEAHAEAVGVVEAQGVGYFDDEETNTFAEVEAMATDMGFDACGGGEG